LGFLAQAHKHDRKPEKKGRRSKEFFFLLELDQEHNEQEEET